jgi:hypothetical protein
MPLTSYDEGDIAQFREEDKVRTKWDKVMERLAHLYEIDNQVSYMSEEWVAAVGDLLGAYDEWLD